MNTENLEGDNDNIFGSNLPKLDLMVWMHRDSGKNFERK